MHAPSSPEARGWLFGPQSGKRLGQARGDRLVAETVGLSDRRDFLPRDLSGGQKQRVAIARALAGSSRVVLADEPTGSLDSQAGRQILTLFRELARRENRSLLIATHDPRVREVADRVVGMRDGQVEEL